MVDDGSQDAGLAMLLLSRPPTNAMTRQVYREVVAAANELGRRDDVAAVILWLAATKSSPLMTTCPNCGTLSAGSRHRRPDSAAGRRRRQAIPRRPWPLITGYAC